MLKNKTKIIAIFLILVLLFSATFVLADNETNDNEIMPISTDTDNDIDTDNDADTDTDEISDSIEESVDNTTLQEDNYKKSDVYLTGDNITIDYIVDGNLFVCANTVTINSQIGGDAFILAKNLIINEQAYVFSNLFTISESIEIKGVVYDVYALAKNLTLSNGYIYRDIKTSCDTLTINGTIGRNAFVNCASMNFNSEESANGVIYGNLNYTSNSEISIPENIVSGSVNYTPTKLSAEKSVQNIISDYILDLGCFLVFVIIIWLICLWLTPKFLENTYSYVGKKSLKILGYGLLTLIAIPIACVILILLELTSSISLLLLALYIIAIVLSKSLFTITANNYLCSKLKINRNSGIFGMLIVSGIIIWVLTQIPYIGGFISFIITVLGLGILIFSVLPKKTSKNNLNSKKDIKKSEDSNNSEK